MKKKQYIIEVSTKSNPSLKIRTRTNNVKQRKDRLRENIMASRGKGDPSLHRERFDCFDKYDLNDITYQLYVVFTPTLDLFGE